ncbi:hypothetical protein ScalyP_jg12167 [Parmales sp. scaly parma]|nr:hypothetical protein ScalyP_jg12167 [Parmales sp. scaly parma]
MSPSGHYPNADWFHLPSFFFGLFIVMGPIPFSAYLFFRIFITVKDMGIEGDLTKRTAKCLILQFVVMMLCQAGGFVDDTVLILDIVAGIAATCNACYTPII